MTEQEGGVQGKLSYQLLNPIQTIQINREEQ